jgi:response regulator RpfG family c-di-GMP phosphodiesterase
MEKSSKQKRNILLVEDDELFRQAMKDYLGEKYMVRAADSAESALVLLNKELPDLMHHRYENAPKIFCFCQNIFYSTSTGIR